MNRKEVSSPPVEVGLGMTVENRTRTKVLHLDLSKVGNTLSSGQRVDNGVMITSIKSIG